MTDSDEQEAAIIRYLLGQSPIEERDVVEERFFSDGEYFDQLLALDDSLIDDFVSGRMPSEQRIAFQESVSLRRDDVHFARALIQVVTKKTLEPVTTDERKNQIIPQEPKRLPLSKTRRALSIAAVLLLAVSVALFVRTQSLRRQLSGSAALSAELKRQNEAAQEQLNRDLSLRESLSRELEIERDKRNEAENKIANIERPDSPHGSSDLMKIVLGITFVPRGTGTAREIRVPQNIRWVRFEIPLKAYGKYESYRISIKPAGQQTVFERASIKATGATPRVLAVIPTNELKPGDYIFTLYGENAGGASVELEQYSFRLTR